MKRLLVLLLLIAAAATARSASAEDGSTVDNYGVCVTRLTQVVGTGQALATVLTSIGPLTRVVTPTGQEHEVEPPGLVAQRDGLEGCPVGVP